MTTTSDRSEPYCLWRPLAAGTVSCLLLGWLGLDVLTFVNDEGIYLEGAQRLLRGEAPYRDFFLISGPGTLWMLAGLFKTLGATLAAGRLLVVLELGILAGLICWLASRVASRGHGAAVSFLFVAYVFSVPGMLTLNHRWDSSMFAVAAVAAAFRLIEGGGRTAALMSGVLAAWAAWCTPNVALPGLALGAFLLAARGLRRSFLSFAAGVLAGSALPAGVLAAQGALGPMLRQMLWSASNYTGANRMPYGSIIGGWASIFTPSEGGVSLARIVLSLAPFLTVVLPPAVLAGVGVMLWRKRGSGTACEKEVWLLVACSGAHLASVYPRMDVGHIYYCTPLFWVLLAALLHRMMPGMRSAVALLALGSLIAPYLLTAAVQRARAPVIDTRAGRLRGPADEIALIRGLQAQVRPGERLFVFPYAPVYYFFTGGLNQTRYMYLQPGMMSEEDEREALRELQAAPPRWLLWIDVPPSEYLRIWPGSSPSRLLMPTIEAFFVGHYETRSQLSGGVRLMERRR